MEIVKVKLLQDETRQATKVLSTYQLRQPQLNEGIQSFISATKSMQIPAYDGEFMSSLGSNKPTKKVKRVSEEDTQAKRHIVEDN